MNLLTFTLSSFNPFPIPCSEEVLTSFHVFVLYDPLGLFRVSLWTQIWIFSLEHRTVAIQLKAMTLPFLFPVLEVSAFISHSLVYENLEASSWVGFVQATVDAEIANFIFFHFHERKLMVLLFISWLLLFSTSSFTLFPEHCRCVMHTHIKVKESTITCSQ